MSTNKHLIAAANEKLVIVSQKGSFKQTASLNTHLCLCTLSYVRLEIKTVHRGAFCQSSFRLIYYYGSNKSNRKETGKTYLCGLGQVNFESLLENKIEIKYFGNMLWRIKVQMQLQKTLTPISRPCMSCNDPHGVW